MNGFGFGRLARICLGKRGSLARFGCELALLGWLLGCFAPPLGLNGQVLPATNLLTEARQVLALSPEEAARKLPVRIRGVVTCYEPRADLMFVQDSTAGVYFYAYRPPWPVRLGQWVEIRGRTDPGRFAPFVLAEELEIMGEAPLPQPKRVTLEQLNSGSADSQWVEVEAVVHESEENWGHRVLTLANGRVHVSARVLQFAPGWGASLPDARLRVRGVAATHYNPKGQYTGVHLIVPAADLVEVLEPAPDDPFTGTFWKARRVLSYAAGEGYGHRVRLRGVVTLAYPGKWFAMKDDSGSIVVESVQTNRLNPGDVVEVAGFAVGGQYSPVIESAIYRVTGRGTPPTAVLASPERILAGEHDSELVEMEGTLVGEDRTRPGERVLLIRAGRVMFPAHVPSRTDGYPTGLVPDSYLRLTGVCRIAMDPKYQPSGLSLWLHAETDFTVLRAPAWWTPRRLSMAALAFSGVGFAAVIWVTLMRRRVARQTAVIAERERLLEARYADLFENANDILFSCDRQGRLTSWNKAGEFALGLTRERCLGTPLSDLTDPASRPLLEERARVCLSGGIPPAYELVMRAHDGGLVFVEVQGRPDYVEGRLVGWRGIAHNITQRKQAALAQRHSEQELRQALEEREKLGQDLHDGIIQSIYAAGLGIEDARLQVRENPETATARLSRVRDQLNRVIRDVRHFILGLQPELARGEDCASALRRLIEDLGPAEAAHFQIEVEPQAGRLLTQHQAVQVLHVAREAISNSLRHAGPARRQVSLRLEKDCVQLKVCDDGAGFDMNSQETPGHGLRNMRARAEDLRARFSLQAAAGRGTCVELDIPLPPSPTTT
jgi:PAS domain S-box-containing protein